MLFNSYAFWLFFVVVWAAYRLCGHRAQNWLLLGASYYFYQCWDWRFLPLIMTLTLVNFFLGMAIEDRPSRAKLLITISAVVSLGILAVFKYFNFMAESTVALLGIAGFEANWSLVNIILPVGISFYTFQTMSYTIDVYRGEVKATRSLRDFALYVAYFPQLVAGPIERSSSLLPQIIGKRKIGRGNFAEGLYLVMIGLFLKVVVGDNLAYVANGVFGAEAGEISGTDALVGVYAFAFQIYGDFAGYSAIARGVSKWLGIDLMTNFRMPYLARDPSDFWRRWHISLSSWLRDYLYIPLGGNRGGKWMIYRNLMLTMLLGGLWHGAGWTFLVWGGLHGAILCLYRLAGKRFRLPGNVGRVVATVLFFHLVCLTWLFFRADTFGQAWGMLGAIFTDQGPTPFSTYGLGMIAFFCAPLMAYEIWLERGHAQRRLEEVPWGWRAAAYCYMIFMLIEFPPPSHGQFIYFQF